jgi:hypothetical protein
MARTARPNDRHGQRIPRRIVSAVLDSATGTWVLRLECRHTKRLRPIAYTRGMTLTYCPVCQREESTA